MALTKIIGKGIGAVDEITSDTAGTSNFVAGVNAGNSIASGGEFNVCVGDEAGTAITTGTDNTFIGALAGDALVDSDHNVAAGYQSLTADTKGSKSTALGAFSLNTQNFTSATDSHNTAIGYAAGGAVTTGTSNTLIGSQSGNATNTGIRNVAIGHEAMYSQTDGSNNVAIGWQAGYANNGSNNVIVGWQALSNQDGSDSCVAIGREALEVATGDSNTAVGYQAGQSVTSGIQNVFVGISAGKNATTPQNSVLIGISAGGNSTLTGNNNVCVGNSAGGEITSGANNIAIGNDAGRSGKPGGALVTTSNNICLGDSAISGFHCQVSLTVASDERDKTDFKDLDLGLDFVKDLKPYTYKWDKRVNYGDSSEEGYDFSKQVPDGTHKEDWLDIGFKAQEVEALEKSKGYDKDKKSNLLITSVDDGKQYGMKYEKFVPILVKAIQELSAKNDALEARIKILEG